MEGKRSEMHFYKSVILHFQDCQASVAVPYLLPNMLTVRARCQALCWLRLERMILEVLYYLTLQ